MENCQVCNHVSMFPSRGYSTNLIYNKQLVTLSTDVESYIPLQITKQNINFCPMCGKELQEATREQTEEYLIAITDGWFRYLYNLLEKKISKEDIKKWISTLDLQNLDLEYLNDIDEMLFYSTDIYGKVYIDNKGREYIKFTKKYPNDILVEMILQSMDKEDYYCV